MHFKNYEHWFLIYLKIPVCSRDINFFVILFFHFHCFHIQRVSDAGITKAMSIGLHKLANAIFGITQEPLCITKNEFL